jgi:hypothetical protein
MTGEGNSKILNVTCVRRTPSAAALLSGKE